ASVSAKASRGARTGRKKPRRTSPSIPWPAPQRRWRDRRHVAIATPHTSGMSRRTVEYRRGTPGGRFSRRTEMRHPPSTRGAPVDQSPDLPTVVRMVQSVSREIVLASLVDRVLVLGLQHGGAAAWPLFPVAGGAAAL